ncbi:E-cinnamoyl-CoA:R-phenyllactate CoA transferase [Sphingomonas jeddahensis]|uniref:E-cinnamoyl-CoA:R-phenyllactate CoA transferase n=2 Tax=Sphingomonas jeddahensis TaxID=1915074 RepID=A0A1V2EUS9_9SPHN|nr:E-cinnamoyl-CoA:R-phenyllactate CoA transferase [Sphingomonas jeddahensis]
MLQGIRVVELASYVAGPGACGILADWGAEVIKVEPPAGDPFRQFFGSIGLENTENRVFDNDNRGKRSIALDLTNADDAEVLRRLVATADVFVTNTRPASLERLGLGWEQLKAIKPDLIFANFTGYGSNGPEADKPGFDITAFWARSGLCALTTVKGGDPAQLRTGIGDHMAAMGLVAGVMGALFHRAQTGQGQKLETSLLRMGIYAASCEHAIQLQMNKLASTKARPEAVNPLNNFFQTSDGQWFVMVPRQGSGDWPRIARAIGRPELLEDERFTGVRNRRSNGPALVDILDAAFGAMTWEQTQVALEAEKIIFGPVQSVAQATRDPQALAAGCYVDAQGSDGTAIRLPATPIDFEAHTPSAKLAPALDADGDAIRAELGIAKAVSAA